MKILWYIFLTLLLISCNSSHNVQKKPALNTTSISEDIEWSQMWMVSVNKDNLPKVLIIGDSHVERYYPEVAAKLNGKAYCSKFTTSRSLGDPALMEQLQCLFFSLKFDIISFNNGLHGAAYTDEQYGQYIPEVYKLFIESNPGMKLIWVNTTASRIKDNIASFDEHNQGVINRNKAVEKFAKERRILLVDLFSLSINHPEYYESDGIHFNKEGVADEARHISDAIIKIIDNSDFIRN
jgi:hypothetical protein